MLFVGFGRKALGEAVQLGDALLRQKPGDQDLTYDVARAKHWLSYAVLNTDGEVVAMAIGGWKRLSAPLVIGSALLTTTIVIASGSQLASLPGWSWLVLGGIALLGLAATIERKSRSAGVS
jgi:hypothetical protein